MRLSTSLVIVLTALAASIAVPSMHAKTAKAGKATGAGAPHKADDPGCRSCTQQAASLFARGEVEPAQKILREWSGKCPNSAQVHLLLSTMLLSTGTHEEAERESALAAHINPSLLAAHLQHAIALMALDRKTQAAQEFERAVEIDPTCYEGWTALASIYKQLHEDDKALDATSKAADLEPGSKAHRMSTLINLKKAGKLSEARVEAKRLLLAPATTPEFAEDVAREALLIGAYDEAADGAAKSIAAHPKSSAPLFTSGLAHLLQKNYSATIEDSDRILALEPQNHDALGLKALAEVKAGKVDDAEALIKTVGADNTSTICWLAKGTVDGARSKHEEADEALHACLEFDQGNNTMQGIPHALAHLQLAQIYKQQNKPAQMTEQIQALSRDKRFALEASELHK